MPKKMTAIREPYTKAQVMAYLADEAGVSRRDVIAVFDALRDLMHRHLKPRSAGVFNLPGLAKITVTRKAATKERKGINPFTKEETVFAAKPARRVVKVRPLKGLKDLAE